MAKLVKELPEEGQSVTKDAGGTGEERRKKERETGRKKDDRARFRESRLVRDLLSNRN